jgi:glutathione peroxidase
MEARFYSFIAKDIQGKEVSMDIYKRKVLLVVNTASKCGFTPQLEGLEALYKKYKDRGLVIMGFPCNQFAGQEPYSEKEIAESCLINYGVTFPMFSKVKVNGKDAHPIFKYLKRKSPGIFGKSIKWNFTKFLIDTNGNVRKRFSPVTSPEKIDEYIARML